MPRRFALLALICAWTLPAQEYRSTITGHITDPSGSAVPNVKVTVIKPDTNIRSVTASSQDGFFTIPPLSITESELREGFAIIDRGLAIADQAVS